MNAMTPREISICKCADQKLDKKPLTKDDMDAERRFDLEILSILGFQGRSGEPKRTRKLHTNKEKSKVIMLRKLGFSHRQIEVITGIPFQSVGRFCKGIKARNCK